jgi:hypothetical protein
MIPTEICPAWIDSTKFLGFSKSNMHAIARDKHIIQYFKIDEKHSGRFCRVIVNFVTMNSSDPGSGRKNNPVKFQVDMPIIGWKSTSRVRHDENRPNDRRLTLCPDSNDGCF